MCEEYEYQCENCNDIIFCSKHIDCYEEYECNCEHYECYEILIFVVNAKIFVLHVVYAGNILFLFALLDFCQE